MNPPLVPSARHSSSARGARLAAALGFASLFCVAASAVSAQDAGAERERRRNTENGGERAERRNLNPQDMQDRMLSSIRERFDVKDDEEWKLISERLGKVMELRRNAGGGGGFMAFGRGPTNNAGDRGDRGGRNGRGPTGASAEMSALSSAVRDNLPDAEIKSRLERVREMRKDNEAKLTKAQEELRAVLTLRQEAVAVMFGLLP